MYIREARILLCRIERYEIKSYFNSEIKKLCFFLIFFNKPLLIVQALIH